MVASTMIEADSGSRAASKSNEYAKHDNPGKHLYLGAFNINIDSQGEVELDDSLRRQPATRG